MVNKLKIMLVIALLITPAVIKKEISLDTAERRAANQRIRETTQIVAKLAPNLTKDRQAMVAAAIHNNSIKYKISKKILMAIIKVESNFKSNAISPTGDYSIVQINLKIWNREFKRLGLPTIDKNRLVKNDDYAISKMCKILNIIKNRYNKDPKWYVRYHSNTPEFNSIYNLKINKVMKLMASK